ncbi:hypothetical protein [Rhodovulum sulfidophilum]|uniref:hypothetical protein n=1 Tax=Rhodovulum sulfidophilum TaxID=35806 RepID=UPI001F48C2EF|nr:hypothetical protein [Rhodovulum sulfidophilum]MCE8441425.1 hypothetical protein [Rhodovulum sulfidophilum]MCE8468059.1 hypothetical protein [Rhodovulum sulfidophilum]
MHDLIEHAAAQSEPLRDHETPHTSGRSRQHEIHYRPECRIRRDDLIAARRATALGYGKAVKKQLDIRKLRPGETFVLLNAFKDNRLVRDQEPSACGRLPRFFSAIVARPDAIPRRMKIP